MRSVVVAGVAAITRGGPFGILLPPVPHVRRPADAFSIVSVLLRLVRPGLVFVTMRAVVLSVVATLRLGSTASTAEALPLAVPTSWSEAATAERAPGPRRQRTSRQALFSAEFRQPELDDALPQVEDLPGGRWRVRACTNSPTPPSPATPSRKRKGRIKSPTPRPPPEGAGARLPLWAPSGMGRAGSYGWSSDSSRKAHRPWTPLTRKTTWIAFHASARVGALSICQPTSVPLGLCPGASTRHRPARD